MSWYTKLRLMPRRREEMGKDRPARTRPGGWITLLLVFAVAGCSLLRQAGPTPAAVPTETVTTEQVARAMQEDHFFSDHRGETLLVQGTVSAVEQKNGETLIRLGTGLPSDVVCDVGTAATTVKAGDSVTAKAQAADAQRSPAAVLLRPCTVQ